MSAQTGIPPAASETRLILTIEATYLGRVFAATNAPESANKYAVGSHEWHCWCAGYQRERLRQELERVHIAAGLERGELSQVADELDAAEPQPVSVWAWLKWEWAFFRWFFGRTSE